MSKAQSESRISQLAPASFAYTYGRYKVNPRIQHLTSTKKSLNNADQKLRAKYRAEGIELQQELKGGLVFHAPITYLANVVEW